MPRHVPVGDHSLRMLIHGQGTPTVVFDTLGMLNLEFWGRLQHRVSRFTRTVAFDHAGCGGSEPGPVPRNARRLASELHLALSHAGIEPPYLLVGYSMGGAYSRVFASMFPEDVAGLVLVDPTQEDFMEWLRGAFPDLTRISQRHLDAQDELSSLDESLRQAGDARLPNVPLTLITGMKRNDPLSRSLLPRWVESHRVWLKKYPHAQHVITTNSGHDIPLREPELIAGILRDMTR